MRCSSLASLTVAALVAVVTSAAPSTINVRNLCDFQVELWDNQNGEWLAPGGVSQRSLPDGFHGMLRHGRDPQATLAEFTIEGGKAWFDISIIPTAPNKGPDYCSSLEDCKRYTGGTGYNVQMQIAPHSGLNGAHCRVLTCMYDGCADAYQYPKDDTKTHNCAGGTEFDLVFCPGGTGGVTPAPTPSPTSEPTPAPTPEPTPTPTSEPTPEPTNSTESRSGDAENESGFANFGSDDASAGVVLETPPETAAPTEAPVAITITEGPAVEANTQSSGGAASTVGTVFLVLGAIATVAGVAMVVVIRRKKAQLDAMEDKTSIALRTSTAPL